MAYFVPSLFVLHESNYVIVGDLQKDVHLTNQSVLHHLSQLRRSTDGWFHMVLPNLLASMQVAIEAHDTFGPGHTRVEDPIDAQMWHNKTSTWRERLGGTISSSGSGDR